MNWKRILVLVAIAASFISGYMGLAVFQEVCAERSAIQVTPIRSGDSVSATPSVSAQHELFDLLMPPKIFAAPGLETSIYFDNLVLVKDSDQLIFSVQCTCRFGQIERRRWVLQPRSSDSGNYEVTIRVADRGNNTLSEGKSSLIVPPQNFGTGQHLIYLTVGDSIGHQSQFPNEIARAASGRRPILEFVGTHRPEGAIVNHEHYGGWKWETFLSHYNPGEGKVYHAERSPFVFPSASGVPSLDIRRYVSQSLRSKQPDIVTFVLGINDLFLFDPNDPQMPEHITSILRNADTLIQEFRTALPHARIGVGVVIPPNYSEHTFREDYKGYSKLTSRWRWKRLQYHLAKRMLSHFQDREREHVFLIPTHATLDPIDGYESHQFSFPGTNSSPSPAIHPGPVGSRQIGTTMYSWIKWISGQPKTIIKSVAYTEKERRLVTHQGTGQHEVLFQGR